MHRVFIESLLFRFLKLLNKEFDPSDSEHSSLASAKVLVMTFRPSRETLLETRRVFGEGL